MKRVTLHFSDADVSALNDLLDTESPHEALALLEREPRYGDPGFFRRIIGWSRANPASGGQQIPFYVRHMHTIEHRVLSDLRRSEAVSPPDPPSWNTPPLFATLASLDMLPRDPGTSRLPTDIEAIRGDIEGAGTSLPQPLPAHTSVRGQSWSLIISRCYRCERRHAIAKPHPVDLRCDPAAANLVHAGATEISCRNCGFGVLEPLFVWVQEQPSTSDALSALSCLIATDSVVIFQPPGWGYRMDAHGVLLEERSADLINSVKLENLTTPVHSFRIVYSAEELRSAISGEPYDPFLLAAAAVTVRLEEPHVTLRDAEEMAGNLATSMNLKQPQMRSPIDERTWFPVACALLSEAIAQRGSFTIPERVAITLHTATCLIAVRKLDAALVAIARAATMVAELPSHDPQRDALNDLVRAARGDVLVRQGQAGDAHERLKILLEADPTGSPLEQSAHWTGRALLALHAKKAEQYAESLRLFCEAIPSLARLVSSQNPDLQSESLVNSYSAALANAAGTLIELSRDANSTTEHIAAGAALVESLEGASPEIEGKNVEESLLTLAEHLVLGALHYSLLWHHFEHIALQSERLADVLIKLKKYDQVESLTVAALGAALWADSNECAARNALRLADHSVHTGHVANVVNMAETAALPAARLSVESGIPNAGVPYGTEACSVALQIANTADVDSRKRIILVVENQKALLTGNALQMQEVPRPPLKIDPVLARRRETLRAELMLLDDHEAETAQVKLDLESTVAQIAREVAEHDASTEWHARLADSRPITNLTPPEAADLLSRLGPRTTLFGMFENGDRAWVYALWPENAEIVELENWISLKEKLETFVDAVASAQVNDEAAQAISSALLRPLVARLPELRAKDRVVISPFGAFTTVPFEALLCDRQYLCELATVSVTLGLGTLAACLDRPKTEPDRLLAVGDPTRTTPRPPPNSRDEVLCLEGLYIGAGRVAKKLLGADATPARVIELMPTSSVVHFACHASAADAILPSRLLLAETAARGESGIVTGEDILRSSTLVDGGVVVLAACESGRMSITVGHDPDALVPAFHRAGASSVLAARWIVRDLPTRLFMEKFHTELLQGQPPASALAATVRACLGGELGELLRAPSMWAAFALFGR